MRHIIPYLAIGIALTAVIGVSACDLGLKKTVPFKPPPPGVLPTKEVLIVDCGKTVASEQEAVALVTERLQEISAVDLVRLPGDITKQTLLKTSAEKWSYHGEPAFLVHIDYRHEYGSEGDVGKLTVHVTREGKIYGTAPDYR